MSQTDDNVVFLTGAADGLGREIAIELAAARLQLALFDVQADKLKALAAELTRAGSKVLPFEVDLADAAATQQAVAGALASYPDPRAFIHDAAVLREVSMAEVTFENWRRKVDVTLQAAFLRHRTAVQRLPAARGDALRHERALTARPRCGARRLSGWPRASPCHRVPEGEENCR